MKKLLDALETVDVLKENLKDIGKEILWYKEKGYVDENLIYSRLGIVEVYTDILKEEVRDGIKEVLKEKMNK